MVKNASYMIAFVALCALWLQGGELFGVGLAFVFVFAGSVLLLLAAVGLDCLRLAVNGTISRLSEGLRDPRDTLTHVLMLAEHSRRNGLIGLAEVETNWQPLQRVCVLVSSAAEESRIRIEAASSSNLARQRSNLVIAPWVFFGVALCGSAILGSVLSGFGSALEGGPLFPVHAFAPVLMALIFIVLLVVPLICRLVVAREREISCIQLAYEGGLKILQNNNVDSVFHELAMLVPGAPVTVTASDIGELDTGRGPWL